MKEEKIVFGGITEFHTKVKGQHRGMQLKHVAQHTNNPSSYKGQQQQQNQLL